jgi:conjugative relaxase-like TrwC/TraI family protein
LLTVHVVRGAGVAYYVRDLVPGRPGETLLAGESPGEWTGGGGEVLGLRGRVGPDDFAEVLAGRDPFGARSLRQDRGDRSVAGVDLTFTTPKSVSLLHLLAPQELGRTAGSSHQAAVADAVRYLERVALGVRRSKGGATQRISTTGVVAAGFVHRTSRALDPHLHTHLVAANVAQGLDGLWSSVDTRRLFLHRRAVQSIYESSLRNQLSERVGVCWEQGTTGRWDIVGVDPVLERLFSQRAASIDEQVFRTGGGSGSPRRRRAAFHSDRPAKDRDRTDDGLQAAWRRRAADLGIDTSDLVDVVGRVRRAPVRDPVDGDVLQTRLRMLVELPGPIPGRDLVAAVADASPAGMTSADVERVAGQVGRAVSGIDDRGPAAASERVTGRVEERWAERAVVRGVDAAGRAAGILSSADSTMVGRLLGRTGEEHSRCGAVAPERPTPGRAPRASTLDREAHPHSFDRIR